MVCISLTKDWAFLKTIKYMNNYKNNGLID
jgi:hypothetical protein